MKWLRSSAPDIYSLFDGILTEVVYIDAQKYRTAAAHGISPSEISSFIKFSKDSLIDIIELDTDGKFILDENRMPKMKKVRGTSISMTLGEYVKVSTIMENIEAYTSFSGDKVVELVKLMHQK